jgi:hypothetical protein
MICIARLTSVIALASLAVAANAELLFTGVDTGRFNANAFTVSSNDTQTLSGLTFRGSTFSEMTSNFFVAFGGAPANPNVNNFGSFALANTQADYTGNTFTLRMMFTSPSGVNGDFFADVVGSVSSVGGGGVLVNFGAPQQFNYSEGTFLVTLNDVAINPGLTASITGTIQATPVPEPASMAAIGLGVVGLLARRRRARRLG